jgi:EAL domain-containing protein (putative c-di-GMP-specific phosphodiesterase class I)
VIVSNPRWRLIGGFVLFAALVLAASALATSMARTDIAEHADVQLKANDVYVFAWSTQNFLSQVQLVAPDGAPPPASEQLDGAIAALEEANMRFDNAVAALTEVSPVGGEIQQLGIGLSIEDAIVGLKLGTHEGAEFAASRLDRVLAITDEERGDRALQIQATAEDAGRVAVAARWLVAVVLPGLAIYAVRRNQRRVEERMRLEAELETERAIQESKTQFVNAVLHHLRTPMSAVLGFAETLRSERHRFNARQRNDMIETIADQATDLGYLMEDLRVASRPTDQLVPIDPTNCDLRRSTETVLTGLDMQHSGYVTVTGYAEAFADPQRLRQILRHLIANARDHRYERVTVSIGSDGDRSWVEVADDGVGLFGDAWAEPLEAERSDPAEELRIGLGLRLSVRLANQMDGNLEYERRGSTTVFRLTLPPPQIVDEVTDRSEREVVSTADVFRLLEANNFEVVLQPIFTTKSGVTSVIGFEALSRFEHGTPPDWLQAAERAGMIVDFELATIRKAVAEVSGLSWDSYLALNVSTDTLLSSELLDACEGMAPERLVFELSEDATVANYERTCAAVDQLTERGYRLALDDVGTGEMDLWHVVRLSPQIVKLDMSLIEGIDEPDNLAIIESILATAARIGATVVAEGIETVPQLTKVRRLGIEAVQGFLLGQPSRPNDPGFSAHMQRWLGASGALAIDLREADLGPLAAARSQASATSSSRSSSK